MLILYVATALIASRQLALQNFVVQELLQGDATRRLRSQEVQQCKPDFAAQLLEEGGLLHIRVAHGGLYGGEHLAAGGCFYQVTPKANDSVAAVTPALSNWPQSSGALYGPVYGGIGASSTAPSSFSTGRARANRPI